MDEPEASAYVGQGGGRQDILLARIRLWTRTSSYSQEPVAVDEAHATGRIVDFSSITARSVFLLLSSMLYHSTASRTRSPPSYRSSTAQNGARETNHANLINGQPTRISAPFNERFERSRALSAKYGLDFTETEWTVPPPKPVQRVERSIRMRIRFRCHHCNTLYGNNRVCSQCSHQRCNRCTRHPPRTTPRVRLADAARPSNALSVENLHMHSTTKDTSISSYMPIPLTNQAYPSGGRQSVPRTEAFAVPQQESLQKATGPEQPDPTPSRIAKTSRLRVHYICHECQKPFSRGESACSACGHKRCPDRPRDPPRRRNSGISSTIRALEHSRLAVCSESDEDGTEFENELAQDAATSTAWEGRALDGVMRPPCASTVHASVNGGHIDVAPPEPPPPV